jgi:ribosomal protein S27E
MADGSSGHRIRFRCSHCKGTLQAAVSMAGTMQACPLCGDVTAVPGKQAVQQKLREQVERDATFNVDTTPTVGQQNESSSTASTAAMVVSMLVFFLGVSRLGSTECI